MKAEMKFALVCLCLIVPQCPVSTSEFQLEGDYVIGGFFDVHHVSTIDHHVRPVAIDCSRHPFYLPNYRRFQLMRFAVEEINNSTDLLPNVLLGYRIYDHCSDTKNYPAILNLLSTDGFIKPWAEQPSSNMIGVVGPFTSNQALIIAPYFMPDHIPLVSYGSSTSILSKKAIYPSFLRTVHPNRATIEVIVHILKFFNWSWVAFLNSDDDFGIDGLEMFINVIEHTDICLAFTKALSKNVNHSKIFKQIEEQSVHVIIVFAPKVYAEALIESAIRLNISNKVWIADEGWALNKELPKKKGIENIGTVLGVSQMVIGMPGFSDFVYSFKSHTSFEDREKQTFCNQICNCSSLSVEEILTADPTFSFPVYSAVYAIAHALHSALQCGASTCDTSTVLYPHMVLAELSKSNFTLLNQSVQFNTDGDPKFGSYAMVFWNKSGEAQEIGHVHVHPEVDFFINISEIEWYNNGNVPTSLCSPPCPEGYRKKLDQIHKCCFTCHICPNGTYANSTEDPYSCLQCKETEWSAQGSSSCNLRLVEYIPFTDSGAVLIMVGAWALVGITLAMSVLFAVNYNTPVVRSAGGPMCFLILGCLSLSTLSIFFYFDKPSVPYCIMRFLPFLLFYTVCIACFVVRSFQIVCVFKMAAKFPKLHGWWMKYHGQWLVITVAFACQAIFLIVGYCHAPSAPYNETYWRQDQIVLSCDLNLQSKLYSVILLVTLCSLCFIFSYMGKDLPKNYNEAKAITFCLLLLILTWIIFATVYILYRGKYIQTVNAVAVLSSLYSFLLWYFLPKCYIIIFQPKKNTQQYFQGLIQNYTKTISQ